MFDRFNLEQTTLSTCFRTAGEMRTQRVSQGRGSRMRTEADLCDSNFVHAGVLRKSSPRASCR